MVFKLTDLIDFWLTPWSAPLRATCCWLAQFGVPMEGAPRPDACAPNWLRPLFLQRWIAQAVAERLAWLAAHPDAPRDLFGSDSAPWWRADGWAGYKWRWLRAQSDASLLHWFAVEVETLTRVAQEAPRMVGSADWTGAALGTCARAIQLYKELKRRHRALPARAMLRAELRRFVESDRYVGTALCSGNA